MSPEQQIAVYHAAMELLKAAEKRLDGIDGRHRLEAAKQAVALWETVEGEIKRDRRIVEFRRTDRPPAA